MILLKMGKMPVSLWDNATTGNKSYQCSIMVILKCYYCAYLPISRSENLKFKEHMPK